MRSRFLKLMVNSLTLTAALSGCGEPSSEIPGVTTPEVEVQQRAPVESKPRPPKEIELATARIISVASEEAAFAAASEDATGNSDAANLRYLSLAYLKMSGASSDQIGLMRKAVAKLINSLSWMPDLVVPTHVDAEGLLLRINLLEYGWTAPLWESLVAGHPAAASSINGVSDLQKATGSSKPLIRAEWFIKNASVPPLYYTLWQAPENISGLEALLKIDFKSNIANNQVIRAGLNQSNVSTNHRVLERHARPSGFLWRSYEFGSRQGTRDIFSFPLGPSSETKVSAPSPASNATSLITGLLGNGAPTANGQSEFSSDGSELFFTLPNGMLAFYIANSSGSRLEQVPGAKTPIVVGGSCMSCHTGGTIPATDEVRNNARVSAMTAERVRQLYVEPTVFNQQIGVDGAAYQAALGKLGISAEDGEPVSAALKMSLAK